MRVRVVVVLLCLSYTQLLRGDDQLTAEDVQSRLKNLQNTSHVEASELRSSQTTLQPDVWTELRELRNMVVEQMVQLSSAQCQLQYSQSQIEELKNENAALVMRVASTEQAVETLRKVNENTPKVAFSFALGLNGYLGPLAIDTILVFSKKITNIGNAFSPVTGVFTAPVRGVFYFRFNLVGNSNSFRLAVCLFKNTEKILDVTKYPNGIETYATSGATLLLEKGDLVYLKLRLNSQTGDNSDNHSTFSGFLLFPM